MKFVIKQTRSYTTEMTIKAKTFEEAERKYAALLESGAAEESERQQMDVGSHDESFSYRISERNHEHTETLGLAMVVHHPNDVTTKYNALLKQIGVEGMLIQFERFLNSQEMADLIVQVEDNLMENGIIPESYDGISDTPKT